MPGFSALLAARVWLHPAQELCELPPLVRCQRPEQVVAGCGAGLGSYPLAVITGDMPIVAAVGVSVSALALALGRPVDAATVLGAAARLRGTEDRSEPQIAELTRNLRAALGEDFDVMFGRGMALDRPPAIVRLNPDLLTDVSVDRPDRDRPAGGGTDHAPIPAAVNSAVTAAP
jgi:hypothetical protein